MGGASRDDYLSRRDQAEVELRLAQKLEAVGRLAAGIAHEINTPMQFVGDSVHFVREAFQELLGAVEAYREATLAASGPAVVTAIDEKFDLEYLRARIPAAFERTVGGIERVCSIVQAMRDFAHTDASELAPADLNAAIRTTLIVARNEYKYVADVDTELGELPLVTCNIGEVNQALLNVIVNAAHAIADVVPRLRARGRIRIATSVADQQAVIRVADDGSGIDAAIAEHVFDPFFTTKPPGRGTGQGLAIVRSIVERHRGRVSFKSEPGRGTEFEIRIPMRADDAPRES